MYIRADPAVCTHVPAYLSVYSVHSRPALQQSARSGSLSRCLYRRCTAAPQGSCTVTLTCTTDLCTAHLMYKKAISPVLSKFTYPLVNLIKIAQIFKRNFILFLFESTYMNTYFTLSTMYNVQCTMYNVQCTMYNVRYLSRKV